MNLKSIAAVTLTLIATSALAAPSGERSCGAGSCSKKTATDSAKKDAACSKKEEAACSKKDEASCSKKESTSTDSDK